MIRTALFEDLNDSLSQFDNPVFLSLDLTTDFWTGNEIIRQQVNSYVKQHLAALAVGHRLSLVALHHPSRSGVADGTGQSGSTAWEGSFRSRLYPEPDKDNRTVRKLNRMKANYAATATEELIWIDGYLMPVASLGVSPAEQRRQLAQEKFLQYFEHYMSEGRILSPSVNSPNYAPLLFEAYAANRDSSRPKLSKKQFADAMVFHEGSGVIATVEVKGRNRLRWGKNTASQCA